MDSSDRDSEMEISCQAPDITGDRKSAEDIRSQNIMAAQAMANLVISEPVPAGIDTEEVQESTQATAGVWSYEALEQLTWSLETLYIKKSALIDTIVKFFAPKPEFAGLEEAVAQSRSEAMMQAEFEEGLGLTSEAPTQLTQLEQHYLSLRTHMAVADACMEMIVSFMEPRTPGLAEKPAQARAEVEMRFESRRGSVNTAAETMPEPTNTDGSDGCLYGNVGEFPGSSPSSG